MDNEDSKCVFSSGLKMVTDAFENSFNCIFLYLKHKKASKRLGLYSFCSWFEARSIYD